MIRQYSILKWKIYEGTFSRSFSILVTCRSLGAIMNANLRWGIYKKGSTRKPCLVDAETSGFYDKSAPIIVNADTSPVWLGGRYLYKSKMVNSVLFLMRAVDWAI